MDAVVSPVKTCLLQNAEDLSEVELLGKSYYVDILVEVELLVSVKNRSKVS